MCFQRWATEKTNETQSLPSARVGRGIRPGAIVGTYLATFLQCVWDALCTVAPNINVVAVRLDPAFVVNGRDIRRFAVEVGDADAPSRARITRGRHPFRYRASDDVEQGVDHD
jgi:hypothetical protein